MQIEYITDELIKLTADENKRITLVTNTNPDLFYETVFLGVNDKIENYIEVDYLGDKDEINSEEGTLTEQDKSNIYEQISKIVVEKEILSNDIKTCKEQVKDLKDITQTLLTYILSLMN